MPILLHAIEMNRKEIPQLFSYKQALKVLEFFEALFPKLFLEEVLHVNINYMEQNHAGKA